MKTKILAGLLLVFGIIYPQSPVAAFYGKLSDGGTINGVNAQTYYSVASENSFVSEGPGEWVWFFTDLEPTIVAAYYNTVPNTMQLEEFPGTTRVNRYVNDDEFNGPKAFF